MSGSLVVTVLLLVAAGLQRTESKVNYKCVYGPLRSTVDARGARHEFCATEMTPPFIQQGAYMPARDSAGSCYECLCDNNIGLACCEKQCS